MKSCYPSLTAPKTRFGKLRDDTFFDARVYRVHYEESDHPDKKDRVHVHYRDQNGLVCLERY